MNDTALKPSGYFYLATPYSKWPGGLDAAFVMAAQCAARLISAGVPVFSPITHSHPIAIYGDLDARLHDIWIPADRPMMDMARALIIYRAEGWDASFGIQQEAEIFVAASKPIHYLDVGPITDEFLATLRGST